MSDKQITPLQYQSIFEYLHDQFGIAANNSDIDDLIEYVSRVQAASLSTGMPSLDKPILTDEDVKAWEKAEPPAGFEKIPFDPNKLKQMEGHEERAEKSWEEIQKRLAHPPAVKGARWIKGDYERLYGQLLADPEKKTPCFIDYDGFSRIDGDPPSRDICYVNGKHLEFRARGIGYGGAESWFDEQDKKDAFLKDCERLNVEWLDESPTAAGDGKEGQELLDWIYENDIIRTEDGTWEKWDNGKALYRLFASGSDELYDIFKNRPQ